MPRQGQRVICQIPETWILSRRERRYSYGLLLTVVRCNDKLPAKHLPRVYWDSYTDNSEYGPESDKDQAPEDDAGQENADTSIPPVEPDPSIHEPLAENGMTAARAWEAARCELQRDMPKAAYDGFVRDLVLCEDFFNTLGTEIGELGGLDIPTLRQKR